MTALVDDSISCQKLYFLGGGGRNDRPNGPLPDYIGGHIHDNKTPLDRKVQRLLNSNVELMVDKGLLKPLCAGCLNLDRSQLATGPIQSVT